MALPQRDLTHRPSEVGVQQPWHGSWAVKGLFFIALIAFMKVAEPLLTPVMVAVVLTFVLAPAVRALRRRGVPTVVGAGVVVIALLTGVGLLGSALVQPAAQWWDRAPTMVAQLIAQAERLRAALPLGRNSGEVRRPPAPADAPTDGANLNPNPNPKFTPNGGSPTAATGTPNSAPGIDRFSERLATEGIVLTGALLGRLLSFALATTATLILLYFLLASEYWMVSRTVEAVASRRTRALILAGARSAQREIARFLGTLALIYSVVGVLTMLALTVIGLPNPLLWGTLVALLNFVPYLGPILIVVLLLMAGLVTFNTELLMLAPAGAFVLIHAVEANLVSPWFVGRRLTLSPLAVFLSIMFWGWLWGLAGAVFAVPLLVGLRSVCKRNRRWRWLCIYMEGNRKKTPSLRSLLRPPRPRAEVVPVGKARVGGSVPPQR